MLSPPSLIGWEPLSDSFKHVLEENPRCIMVYPHTSFCDFFLYLCYIADDPVLRRRSRVLINPHFTDKYWWLVKHVGAIRSTKRENTGGGAVARIQDELSQMDEFVFIISPKGLSLIHI